MVFCTIEFLTKKQVIDTSSEEFRHYTEVKEIIRRFKSVEERREYLDGVEKRRGKDAAEKLKQGLIAEWKRKEAGL